MQSNKLTIIMNHAGLDLETFAKELHEIFEEHDPRVRERDHHYQFDDDQKEVNEDQTYDKQKCGGS